MTTLRLPPPSPESDALRLPPPSPESDDKDWTWVLKQECPQCSFVAAEFDATTIGDVIRANSQAWVGILAGPEQRLRTRPADELWSALEYGAHVRDVFVLYLARLGLMLDNDGPDFADWDQNVTAVEMRYDLSDPAVVSGALTAAANALADRFDSVVGDQWQRAGYRSDGAAFTIDSFARYMIHDPIHHVWDVEQGFRSLDSRDS